MSHQTPEELTGLRLDVARLTEQCQRLRTLLDDQRAWGEQKLDRLRAITCERDAYLANLTATQARCSELLTEVRALRRRSDPAYRTPHALDAIVAQLGPDEVRVLTRIAERLVMGGKQYGALDIANDRRDWTEEARQEVLDLAVYAAIKLEAGR